MITDIFKGKSTKELIRYQRIEQGKAKRWQDLGRRDESERHWSNYIDCLIEIERRSKK